MAEVYDFREGWKRRIDKTSKVVEDACDKVDLAAPGGSEKMKALAEMVKNVSVDTKNFAEMEDNEAKNTLESERNSIDLAKVGTEATKTEVEREKNKWLAKVDILKVIVSVLGVMFGPLLAFFIDRYKERKRDERFKIANKFEDEDAYIKSSQRKAVDEGLRDTTDKPGRWGTFFKQ